MTSSSGADGRRQPLPDLPVDHAAAAQAVTGPVDHPLRHGSLLAFDQFYVLTKGGPDNSTVTIVQLVYTMAFQGQNDLGRAAALSIIVLGGLLVLNALQFLGLRGNRD